MDLKHRPLEVYFHALWDSFGQIEGRDVFVPWSFVHQLAGLAASVGSFVEHHRIRHLDSPGRRNLVKLLLLGDVVHLLWLHHLGSGCRVEVLRLEQLLRHVLVEHLFGRVRPHAHMLRLVSLLTLSSVLRCLDPRWFLRASPLHAIICAITPFSF